MATTEQKKTLLKAKIAVALHDELGMVPKTKEIDRVFLLVRLYTTPFSVSTCRRRKTGGWLFLDF
jgi:hypothetical protein